MKKKTLLNILKYVFFLGAGIALLIYSFSGIDRGKLLADLQDADGLKIVIFISLALLVTLLSHFFRALRWKTMLSSLGHEVNLWNAYASLMTGYGFNNIVPRGGEVMRCTMLFKSEKVPVSEGMGSVITERIIDFIVLLILLGGVLILEFDTLMYMVEHLGDPIRGMEVEAPTEPAEKSNFKTYFLIVMGVLGVIGGVVFLVFRKKIMETKLYQKVMGFVKQMVQAAVRVTKLKNPWSFLFHTLMIWVCYIVMTWLPFLALESTDDLSLYFGAIVLTIGGLGIVFPSPGGLGSYHFAVAKTFDGFHNMGAEGLTIATIIHASQMLMTTVVGGLAYLFLRSRWPKEEETPAEEETTD